MPWKLMESATSVFTFLNIVGGILAPVTGIMLAQYFIISKKNIDLNALYDAKKGRYYYKNGFNVNAIVTTIIAGVVCLIGNVVPFFKPLYDMSWFVGIIIAFILYTVLESAHSKRTLLEKTPELTKENS